MLETWLIEIVIGVGKLFLNPLLYWIVLLFFIMGWRRIKRERRLFRTKIYPILTESKGTLLVSIVFSMIISLVAILVGMVFSYEIIFVLIVVTILVSLTGRTTFLSASYTLGLTFLFIVILQYLPLAGVEQYLDFNRVTIVQLLTIAFLLSLLLFAEALLLHRRNGANFPEMKLGLRGKWIGQHRLKRAAFIPFFALLPVDQANVILPLFPYFEYAHEGYQLILLPFIIGVNYTVQSDLPHVASKRLGQATWILSVIVMFIALVGLYFPYATIVAVLVAVIGKEWITYRHKKQDKYKQAIFTPLNKGVKVLAVLPESPAERIGIHIGETITKVNNQIIQTPTAFYEALQNSGASFKLDVIDERGEIRFINSVLYEEDHHELGVVFVEEPNENKRIK